VLGLQNRVLFWWVDVLAQRAADQAKNSCVVTATETTPRIRLSALVTTASPASANTTFKVAKRPRNAAVKEQARTPPVEGASGWRYY
jgi:hypothetical protein